MGIGHTINSVIKFCLDDICRYSYQPYFTGEETELGRISDLPRVMQLVSI